MAHVFSWKLKHGQLPFDKYVLHRCDTPACVNPDHLWIGSLKDNTQDASQKGRLHRPIGELHPMVKLTPQQISDIRFLYWENGVKQKILSEIFNVGQAHISRIVLSKRWSNL